MYYGKHKFDLITLIFSKKGDSEPTQLIHAKMISVLKKTFSNLNDPSRLRHIAAGSVGGAISGGFLEIIGDKLVRVK